MKYLIGKCNLVLAIHVYIPEQTDFDQNITGTL